MWKIQNIIKNRKLTSEAFLKLTIVFTSSKQSFLPPTSLQLLKILHKLKKKSFCFISE